MASNPRVDRIMGWVCLFCAAVFFAVALLVRCEPVWFQKFSQVCAMLMAAILICLTRCVWLDKNKPFIITSSIEYEVAIGKCFAGMGGICFFAASLFWVASWNIAAVMFLVFFVALMFVAWLFVTDDGALETEGDGSDYNNCNPNLSSRLIERGDERL